MRVNKTGNYPVKASEIKDDLAAFLKKRGIVSDCRVSVAFVNEKKMLDISKKYLKDDNVHEVLSFTEQELKRQFVYPPKQSIFLGEIIVCYPLLLKLAKKEKKRIDKKAKELIRHGAKHLLGIHHD